MSNSPSKEDVRKAAQQAFGDILQKAEAVGLEPLNHPFEGGKLFTAVFAYFKGLQNG